MKSIIMIAHVVVSILLILAVLSQNRSSGLSATFGGSGGGTFYGSKRGAEKVLSTATVVLSILFLGLSVAYLFA